MHKQFNKQSRIELGVLKKAGFSNIECAIQIGIGKSNIGREIERYRDEDGVYRGSKAHKKYLFNRKESKKKFRKIQNDSKLKRRIKLEGKLQKISYETIYQWIFIEEPELKQHLRYIGKKGKYRRKRGTNAREKAREQAKIKRIDERPAVVENRERIGDFEGDTIIGKDRTKRLLSCVDRKSGYGMLNKLDIVSAERVQDKVKDRFKKIPRDKKYTYTYDNGTEIGKEDSDFERKIKMDIYRAFPYRSWERGSNENYNGLVRYFFPKGTDFATITDKDVLQVERNLNHRPRKRLGYLTPYEVFILRK